MAPRRHITPRMLAANRANAQRSTGPRTAAGKARSRRNGLVHGLRAATLAPLLAGDAERAEYAALVEALRADFAPAGPLEEPLIYSLAEACLGIRRGLRAEAAAMVAAAAGGDPRRLVSTMMAVMRYQAPHKRRFTQSLRALTRIQDLRRRLAADLPTRKQPQPAPLAEEAHAPSPQPASRPLRRAPCRPARRRPWREKEKNGQANPIFTLLYAARPPPGPRLPLLSIQRSATPPTRDAALPRRGRPRWAAALRPAGVGPP